MKKELNVRFNAINTLHPPSFPIKSLARLEVVGAYPCQSILGQHTYTPKAEISHHEACFWTEEAIVPGKTHTCTGKR